MRRISSRWLLIGGLLAAMGGCRHLERPGSGSIPEATRPEAQPMPSIPLATAVPDSAAKPVAKRPAPKQEPVQQVEYRPAAATLAHAPDHSWLVGRLERDEAKDRWFVRYADPGECETFGGRLELVRTGSMAGFQAGQTVRAEGKLVDPAPYETRPAYSILSLQAIRE